MLHEYNKLHNSRYANYLEAFKQSHINDSYQQAHKSTSNSHWEVELKNTKIPENQRRERVIMKSKMLEEKARRQEQFVNNSKYEKAEDILERKKEIDENIIGAIRAKVAVIKSAQDAYN